MPPKKLSLVLLSCLAGAAAGLSLPHDAGVVILPMALTVLLWAAAAPCATPALQVFGWFFFCLLTSLPWLVWPLASPGEWSFVWALVLLIGLLALHASLYALVFAGLGLFKTGMGLRVAVTVFFVEIIRTQTPLALPWAYIGYSQVDNPIVRGLFPLGGVFAVSAFVCLWSGVLLSVFKPAHPSPPAPITHAHRRNSLLLLFALTLLASATSTFTWTSPEGPPIAVRVVHTHLMDSQKYEPAAQASSQQLMSDLAGQNDVAFTLFPELFLVMPAFQYDKAWRTELVEILARSGGHLLVGMPDAIVDGGGRVQGVANAVVHLGPNGKAGSQSKEKLIPFAEQTLDHALTRAVFGWFKVLPNANFSPGAGFPVHTLLVNNVPLGISICSEIADPFTVHGRSRNAQLLVNVASESWIDSPVLNGLMKRAIQARAMEAGKPMLRSSNVGTSGLITPSGAIHPTEDLHQIVQAQPASGVTPVVAWLAWWQAISASSTAD